MRAEPHPSQPQTEAPHAGHNYPPLYSTAVRYVEVGLSVIPTDPWTKVPVIPWKGYQTRLPTGEELEHWFITKGFQGLGIVCGAVSGGLETLDFDHNAALYDPWLELVEEEAPGLTSRLVVQKTQNKGRHGGYRCTEVTIPGNMKLAVQPVDVTDQVLAIFRDSKIDPADRGAVKKMLPSIGIEIAGKRYVPILGDGKFMVTQTMIETRGEGGQFLAHPTRGYELLQGSFTDLPEITPEERRILINAAVSLNEWVDPHKVEGYGRRLPRGTEKPGDDFNERGDVLEILAKHRWEPVGARGAYQHFRRPGKDRGQSASLIDGKWFRVFTTNGFPFEAEKTYSPFAVFALLECGGDFTSAASELSRKGYGGNGFQTIPTSKEATEKPVNTFLPSPPPFPIDVFPERSQRAIINIQRAHATPVEIPAGALLSMAGSCISRTRGIQIKAGWIEHANLWLVEVGGSGVGKSPVVRAIQRPVFAAEKKWYAEYKEALEAYEREIENRKSTPREERGQLPPPPNVPSWRQLIVDDTTTEALTDAIDANPRGILWNRDELSGLIQDLDKYSGKDGGTKSRLMSSYDSAAWKVNRRDKSKKAFILNATLSIFGTIQPKALPTIFSNLDAAIGFLPRFIFINASQEEPPLWTDETVSAETHEYLVSLVEGLLSLNFNDYGEPIVVGVSPEAKAAYRAWFNEQVMEPWVDTDAEIYEAVLAKLRGQCLRIALILHCVEAVTRGSSELVPVSFQTMQNAIRLADCLKAHQKNVWQFVTNPEHVSQPAALPKRVARAIVDLVAEIHGGMLPTARIAEELNRGFDPKFHISVESVGKAAGKLGLNHGQLPDKSARTVVITESDLNKIKSIFKITVRTVPNPDGANNCGQNRTVPHPSEVSGGGGVSIQFGKLMNGSEIGPDPQGIKPLEGQDGLDASLHTLTEGTKRLVAWDTAISKAVGAALEALDVSEVEI